MVCYFLFFRVNFHFYITLYNFRKQDRKYKCGYPFCTGNFVSWWFQVRRSVLTKGLTRAAGLLSSNIKNENEALRNGIGAIVQRHHHAQPIRVRVCVTV